MQRGTETDASWADYVVLEHKNAPGLAGDASSQAAVWYGKHCNSIKVKNIMSSQFSNTDAVYR